MGEWHERQLSLVSNDSSGSAAVGLGLAVKAAISLKRTPEHQQTNTKISGAIYQHRWASALADFCSVDRMLAIQ